MKSTGLIRLSQQHCGVVLGGAFLLKADAVVQTIGATII